MGVGERKNEGLARLLGESRWTYRQFAMAVNRLGTETGSPVKYDESSVHHWLSGTLPRKAVRPLVLEALARKLRRPVTHAEAGFPAPEPKAAAPTSTVEGLVDLGRLDMDPSRRGVLGAGLFSVALTIPGWQDVVGRAEAVQSGRAARIGQAEVDMVVAMTERISELDDQFGGRHARPMAATFMVNTVAAYLRADATPEVRKGMLSAAADLSYLTGWMAVDEGYHGLAQSYYTRALELAGAAHDYLTYCTTLRGMSVQAVDLGHAGPAMQLADAAAAASPQAGPRMRAFLAGQQAHSAALAGDHRNALRYLDEAEVAMEKAEAREKAFGSYGPSSLLYHVSQVRYGLGDIRGSIVSMEDSQKLRRGDHRRSRVRFRSLTAERQLEVGHLEAACASWHLVLDDYPLVHSAACDDRVDKMRGLIRPHLKNAKARELYDRAMTIKRPVAV
ncbi:tetratricopeptide repeat protein [Streptomyces rectiverticillatus]|uniref:tetratricopeptide repeat protein n=1 Tax=Streptomyces rectiverticillatus TaxID=173860 RepID=UPI0015C3A03E|nr:tetratricopeptide repeat protein [Streptomyces rectiverticillatus]QLE71883.1 tetratricopeptide repeat protein [Streptomyces rectiverticillatus]